MKTLKSKPIESTDSSFVPKHRKTMDALAKAPLTGQQFGTTILTLNRTAGYLRLDHHGETSANLSGVPW